MKPTAGRPRSWAETGWSGTLLVADIAGMIGSSYLGPWGIVAYPAIRDTCLAVARGRSAGEALGAGCSAAATTAVAGIAGKCAGTLVGACVPTAYRMTATLSSGSATAVLGRHMSRRAMGDARPLSKREVVAAGLLGAAAGTVSDRLSSAAGCSTDTVRQAATMGDTKALADCFQGRPPMADEPFCQAALSTVETVSESDAFCPDGVRFAEHWAASGQPMTNETLVRMHEAIDIRTIAIDRRLFEIRQIKGFRTQSPMRIVCGIESPECCWPPEQAATDRAAEQFWGARPMHMQESTDERFLAHCDGQWAALNLPDARELPQYIRHFIDWFNGAIPRKSLPQLTATQWRSFLRDLSDVEAAYLSVHPHDNGNGRMAALLLRSMTARLGVDCLPTTPGPPTFPKAGFGNTTRIIEGIVRAYAQNLPKMEGAGRLQKSETSEAFFSWLQMALLGVFAAPKVESKARPGVRVLPL